jgi:hypothetical protein
MNAPAARSCWGIYRELAHSPGREVDDAEILRATARRLETLGLSVTLLTPEEAAEAGDLPPLAFLMCERLPILEKLARWEASGTRLVNRVESIRNTYRNRMIPLVERYGVPFPESVLVATHGPVPSPPSFALRASEGKPGRGQDEGGAFWVKRGDVHNTQEGDVVFAADHLAAVRALEGMAARGIGTAVLQEHVAGDLIKFYGIQSAEAGAPAKAEWFQWFYHRDQRLAGHSFDAASLEQAATQAARALGLEVYGGDAIAAPSGRLVVIDVNAWPSFSLYRETASERIAAHLAEVYREQAGRVRALP